VKIATQRDILRRFFELRAAHTTTLAPEPYRQQAAVYTDPDCLAVERALALAADRTATHTPLA
jgi:hypothetical protein